MAEAEGEAGEGAKENEVTITTNGQRPVLKHRTRPNRVAPKEGYMADLDVTKKLHVYHLIYRLNLSFAAIVRRCRGLEETGIFPSKSLRRLQGFAQELQAEINSELIETLNEYELDDWNRYGKMRDAWEKWLRDPDDVFIHAEERRRELRRQGKKLPLLAKSVRRR